jgi:hypothetical protein
VYIFNEDVGIISIAWYVKVIVKKSSAARAAVKA